MRGQAKVYLLAEARVFLLREKPRSGLSCYGAFLTRKQATVILIVKPAKAAGAGPRGQDRRQREG